MEQTQPLTSVTLIALSISAVEYLIQQNHLTGVDDILDVGRLIPFLVGVFGLGGALVSITLSGQIQKARC
jgi:hypothetical protein